MPFYMIIIEKSHSKNDLIDLINTLDLRVVFSHQDNKKSIQDKLIDLLQNREKQTPFKSVARSWLGNNAEVKGIDEIN